MTQRGTFSGSGMGPMAMSRRSMVKTGVGAGITAAAIAIMTFPQSMAAQTPVGEIPP